MHDNKRRLLFICNNFQTDNSFSCSWWSNDHTEILFFYSGDSIDLMVSQRGIKRKLDCRELTSTVNKVMCDLCFSAESQQFPNKSSWDKDFIFGFIDQFKKPRCFKSASP